MSNSELSNDIPFDVPCPAFSYYIRCDIDLGIQLIDSHLNGERAGMKRWLTL